MISSGSLNVVDESAPGGTINGTSEQVLEEIAGYLPAVRSERETSGSIAGVDDGAKKVACFLDGVLNTGRWFGCIGGSFQPLGAESLEIGGPGVGSPDAPHQTAVGGGGA